MRFIRKLNLALLLGHPVDVYLLHVLAIHICHQCPMMAAQPEHVAVSNTNQTYNMHIIVFIG